MPFATPRLAAHIKLGDLIAIVYDEAQSLTGDDAEATRLATEAVYELLATTRNDRAIRDLIALCC